MGAGGQNRLNTEIFINRSVNKYGYLYDYSEVEYTNNNTKVKIGCPLHGKFLQTPKIHIKSNGCPECSKERQSKLNRKSQEQFKKESIELYGNKYDLNLVEYINNKVPVKISCDIHGLFEVKPEYFLKGKACKICCKKKTKSTDKETFIKKAIEVYSDKDDYTNTEIISSKHEIDIRCKKHNFIFTKNIQTYLAGWGCPKCSAENYSEIRTKNSEDFIKEAKKVHGDNCDYTDTIYKGCREKITVKCNVHNIYFKTLPNNHIRGARCRNCLSNRLRESNIGKEGNCGYTKSGYIKQANGRESSLYLIRCWNEDEEFYKIGKTFLNINNRFKKCNMPYNFEEVHFHYGEAGYIYDLENELHKKYREYKYRPNNWFAGYTECYMLSLPIVEIIKKYE